MQRMPISSSREGVSDILQTFFRKAFAHLVDVETQLAGSKALALVFFGSNASFGLGCNSLGFLTRNDADAVIVSDDDVTRTHIGASADDWHVNRTQRL